MQAQTPNPKVVRIQRGGINDFQIQPLRTPGRMDWLATFWAVYIALVMSIILFSLSRLFGAERETLRNLW